MAYEDLTVNQIHDKALDLIQDTYDTDDLNKIARDSGQATVILLASMLTELSKLREEIKALKEA